MPVFKLGSSLESWGLSLFLFQSVWVCWLLCWIKCGRSDSVPVFWAEVWRACSLHFLCIKTPALGEASCRVRSLTTLRPPCWEEAQDTRLERLCGARDANQWSQQGVRRVKKSPQVIPASDGKRAHRTMKKMWFWAIEFLSGWLSSIRKPE